MKKSFLESFNDNFASPHCQVSEPEPLWKRKRRKHFVLMRLPWMYRYDSDATRVLSGISWGLLCFTGLLMSLFMLGMISVVLYCWLS